MEKPQKKRHHFVQVAYLLGFSDVRDRKRGKLYCLDREQKCYRIKNPNQVAYQDYLYEIKKEGVDPDILENAFGEGIEKRGAEILISIIGSNDLPQCENERKLLAQYIAFTYYRHPEQINNFSEGAQGRLRKLVSSPRRIKKWLKNNRNRLPSDSTENMQEIKENFQQFYKLNPWDQVYLETVFEEILGNVSSEFNPDIEKFDILNKQAVAIYNRKWSLIHIEQSCDLNFYTSNKPAMLITPAMSPDKIWHIPELSYSIDLMFPISKKSFLIGSHEHSCPDRILADYSLVNRFNQWTFENAYKMIFSPIAFGAYMECPP